MSRICTACGKPMNEGYVIDEGMEYYCSDKCLHTAYTDEAYRELYKEDCAYWTQWEDDDDSTYESGSSV